MLRVAVRGASVALFGRKISAIFVEPTRTQLILEQPAHHIIAHIVVGSDRIACPPGEPLDVVGNFLVSPL